MAISVLFNGVVYSVPETGEESWGESLTSYLTAIAAGCLQKTGGAFTLTADANFGANFGLLSKYFSTRTASPSTAGLVRLAVSDSIGWRNNIGNGNLLLAVNGSDQLTFNGTAIYPAGITALTGDVTATGPGSVAATIAANAVTNAKMATMVTGTAKANISGSTATPSDVSLVSAGTASTIMLRDVNANSSVNNMSSKYATTVTAAGTTTLTVASAKNQYFTGTTTQNLVLPDATTLPQTGFQFYIVNLSSGAVTIKDAGGSTVLALPAVSFAIVTATSISTSNGSWDVQYSSNNAGGGTVTSVAMTVPTALFATSPVSGSPITLSGTLAPTLATQTANKIFAGPISGGAATPTFRSLIGSDVLSQGLVTRFITSGTFTTPSTSTTSTIYQYEIYGGGGGGGGGAGAVNGGGGGGAGAYARGTFTGIAPSTGITVTINSGGAGGASTVDGSAGGSASLALATAITCGGGGGGKGSTGGSGFSQGGAGGTVTSGTPNIISVTGQNGSNGFGVSGTFGLGGTGGGGGNSTATSGVGDNATIYGAGGGGGGPSNAGGNGKDGLVIIAQLTP